MQRSTTHLLQELSQTSMHASCSFCRGRTELGRGNGDERGSSVPLGGGGSSVIVSALAEEVKAKAMTSAGRNIARIFGTAIAGS